MEPQSVLVHSKTAPFGFDFTGCGKLSPRHINKHLQGHSISPICHSQQTQKPLKTQSDFPFYPKPLSFSSKRARTHFLTPLNCSISNATSPDSRNPLLKPLKNLLFDSLKDTLLQLTPYDIVKWSAVLSVSVAAAKWTLTGLFNPFFWMYFSWTWMFWPWILAAAVAVYGLYCFRKYSRGEANIFEQLAVVTSAFTWLTLVPPAHFNGFLEGWPFVFFFVYHYFFFFNVSVRKRLYGDYHLRSHDPKWNVNPPRWCRLLFCVGVMVGHWLAAFEGPELHRIGGGWSNVGIWVMVLVTLFMQYNSTLYLAKYSEKVVVPTAVVQFGPYRWVRHPIYASTMLLFAGYCISLRAPLALLFVVAVCLWYYEQKAKLEEALMVETFGESYVEYASKVRYKFIPCVY
ncbi:Phospholipid methyltransferase [Parasponia andersonii]|uniref:Phospholipid methyltransferase n=1 Tax=Parasponia andersonii TaxID=3476 RepID=A0A2P5DQL6_PARAD|nr:Phospholipid methyltransferase [Parasponia andersonii]